MSKSFCRVFPRKVLPLILDRRGPQASVHEPSPATRRVHLAYLVFKKVLEAVANLKKPGDFSKNADVGLLLVRRSGNGSACPSGCRP